MSRITDEEFINLWRRLQSPAAVAKAVNISVRATMARRNRLEVKHQIVLKTANQKHATNRSESFKQRLATEELSERRFTALERDLTFNIIDGTVVVFSDAHYWPGHITVAHRALLAVCKTLKPTLVVANGDVLDGATISRHPRIGWEQRPSVQQEIETLCARMAEIERAAKGAELIRTVGNHDARFENYVAANAPALEGVHGTSLFDFLPRWKAGFALHINPESDGWTVVRHTHVAGGIHSAYNSTLRAGTNYVHGHLHKLQVVSYGDYRGRRYGIDTGTLAEPLGPQFTYVQGGPVNWCSGFAVMTFKEGRLLPPELVEVIDGTAWFRGTEVKLEPLK